MFTIETNGLPSIDKEDYYISEDIIGGEDDEDEEGPSAGGTLDSDSGSTFHLLLNLLLRDTGSGSNLHLLFSLLLATGLPTLGDLTGADQHLVQRTVQVVHVEEHNDIPGEAVTTLKAHPSLAGVGPSEDPGSEVNSP